MGDRHKNFEDPITWTQDIRKTKIDLLGFFWATLYLHFIQNHFLLFPYEHPANKFIKIKVLVLSYWNDKNIIFILKLISKDLNEVIKIWKKIANNN